MNNQIVNKKFADALEGKNLGTPPIWMMRQAGRYHSHYQNLRKNNSFSDLCKIPDLAAQVALGPVEDFDFDVAILFSDILFPLQALGFGLDYTDAGPKLSFRLSEEMLPRLKSPDEAILELAFQKEALIQTRKVLPKDKSLIGFVGGLWTLFVYAIEGSHAGALVESKKNLNLYPKFLEIMQPLIEKNIALQFSGGAEVVMIFDTAAGELSAQLFNRVVAPSLLKICKQFGGKVAYYSKTTQPHYFSDEFKAAPWAGMGFDHRCDLPALLAKKSKGFVQGNFDQGLLHLPPADFRFALNEYLEPFKKMDPTLRRNWVCGLGHGVLPKTPEENVRSFVRTVREVFK